MLVCWCCVLLCLLSKKTTGEVDRENPGSEAKSAAGQDGEVLVCSSSGDNCDLLCASAAPGISAGSLLDQPAGEPTKKKRKVGSSKQRGLTEETLQMKIAAVCEVQAALSLDSRDDGSFVLTQENRYLKVSHRLHLENEALGQSF